MLRIMQKFTYIAPRTLSDKDKGTILYEGAEGSHTLKRLITLFVIRRSIKDGTLRQSGLYVLVMRRYGFRVSTTLVPINR